MNTCSRDGVVHGAGVDGRVVRLGVCLAVLAARRQVLRGVVPSHAAVIAALRTPGNTTSLYTFDLLIFNFVEDVLTTILITFHNILL